ncbi:MAG TPA: RES domain-containing protein [Balneolaceae bacterium]|nr:RES domain-containing protein [Balneolaceae bacterium]
MIVWRLAKKIYIRDLSGEGARIAGGRWNNKGTPLLYTSAHCSLALLEFLANTQKEMLPNNIHFLKLKIPNHCNISSFSRNALPDNWRQYPAPLALARLGTNWCKSMDGPILRVPSVLVPHEANYLLNPQHAQFKQCKIIKESSFKIDFRIL